MKAVFMEVRQRIWINLKLLDFKSRVITEIQLKLDTKFIFW